MKYAKTYLKSLVGITVLFTKKGDLRNLFLNINKEWHLVLDLEFIPMKT